MVASSMDTSSMVESDMRSMRADIARLSDMEELQNGSIDIASNVALQAKSSVREIRKIVDDHDIMIYDMRNQLRRWQTLVLVMAGWMLVGTVLWCFGVIS